MTDIPPAALHGRQMYIQQAPTQEILAETGLSHWALYHWIDGGPKIDGKRLLPTESTLELRVLRKYCTAFLDCPPRRA